MDKKITVIAASIMIFGVLAGACTPDTSGAIPANNNIAPVEIAQPGQGITPVVPSGGTEDDPVINLMGSCSSFEHFNIHVLFSPTSLTITQVHSLRLGETISCNLLQAGDMYCTNVPSNPYMSSLNLDVCYRGSDTVDETCRQVSMITPGCSGIGPASLVSVECLPGSRVRFILDVGTRFSYGLCAWMGDAHENCSMTSYRRYGPCPAVADAPTQVLCEGDAPIIDVPLKLAFYIRGMNEDTQEKFIYQFNDFFSQANRCILRPTEEPSKESQPPAQTCEDQKTSDNCKAFGGCYWWSSGGCYSNPEPPPPSCSDHSGIPDKCKEAGCNYWSDGTCSENPEPSFDCHQYDGNYDKCSAETRCSWDKDNSLCNPN